MSYRENSEWNEKNEIRCLIIFKKLEKDNFPRGKQMDYCRELEKITNLDAGNISAKVSNYKSVAGVNNSSNASVNTVEIYKKYKSYSISELEALLK
tara:strand:+ start:1858 stop:2145 length:288 start_codon:yes stop_codon:yes gene_type:complete